MPEHEIVILGHGEMGHAFARLLKGRPYTVWNRSPQPGCVTDLAAAVGGARWVFFCLPVSAHAAVAEQLSSTLPATAVCISIAKGLDEAGRPAASIFSELLPQHRHAVLYGPMISEEIQAGRPAFAQVGTGDPATYAAIAALFRGTPLALQACADVVGISWAVVLKNVYAILFGVADEMGLGDNMRGHLMVTALAELSRIVVAQGGRAESPFGLAGLGDLTTTATSEGSHHHSLGRCLARGDCAAVRGEGVHTLAMVQRFRLLELKAYPLFRLAAAIIATPAQTRAAMLAYLTAVQAGESH